MISLSGKAVAWRDLYIGEREGDIIYRGKLPKTTSTIGSLTVSYLVFKKFQCYTLSSNLLQCHTSRQLSVNYSVKMLTWHDTWHILY